MENQILDNYINNENLNINIYTLDDFLNEPLYLKHDIIVKIDKDTPCLSNFNIKINNIIRNRSKHNIIQRDLYVSDLSKILLKNVDKLVSMDEYDKNHWKCRYIVKLYIDKKISYEEAVYKIKNNKFKMDQYKLKNKK